MANERQVLETVARCVATVVFYHNSPRTRHTATLQAAEARTAAVGVVELGLKGAQVEELVVRPVEAELVARYGAEKGRALSREFFKAFVDPPGPVPLLSPSGV